MLARLKLQPSICECFRLCTSFVNVRFSLALRHSGVWVRWGALCGEMPGSYRTRRRAHACEARFLRGSAHDRRPIKLSGRFSFPMFHVKHRGFLLRFGAASAQHSLMAADASREATMICGRCGISALWLFLCVGAFLTCSPQLNVSRETFGSVFAFPASDEMPFRS